MIVSEAPLVGAKRTFKPSSDATDQEPLPQKCQKKEFGNKCIKSTVSKEYATPSRCADQQNDHQSPPSCVSFGHILPPVSKDNIFIDSTFLELNKDQFSYRECSDSKESNPNSVKNEKSLNSTSSLTEQSLPVLPLSSPRQSDQQTSDEAI